MTEPVAYEFQPPAEIEAMYNNGDVAVVEDIVNWITPLLGVNDSSYVAWGNKIYISMDGGINHVIAPNSYVYHDVDGFHIVDKGPFELVYKVSDGV